MLHVTYLSCSTDPCYMSSQLFPHLKLCALNVMNTVNWVYNSLLLNELL